MKKFIFVFLFTCTGAESAQLVGSEITLCTNGFSPDGSTCTTYGAGECESGYYDLTPTSTSFVAPSGSVCNVSGYKINTLPDTIITIVYHGAVIGEEILLCSNGYSPDNSTCSSYSTGDCASGYHEIVTSATSFVAPSGSVCNVSGYKKHTMPDTITTITYHGALIGGEITLCANGYSSDGSTCTTYGTSNCPTDYYNVNVGATSFAENTGSCASGYKQYEAEDSCGFEPEGKTCVNFCENGEIVTGTGGCSALCGEGATTFRTSTGLKYPLWATKQTTPSLNVGFASGNRCYMSLTSEPTNTQSIWFQWENNKMHATK